MDNFTVMTNITDQKDNIDGMPIFKVAFTLVLVAIMFGMGCAVDYLKLKENLKTPAGLIVGLICQTVLMPTLTYAIIKIPLFSLTPAQALALALIGLSPGGSNSNVITYLIKGDISLSVAMTTCSNMLALATVPMWIFLYAALERVHEDLTIDYISLGITLLSIALPVTAGIFFKYKFPKKARIVPKVAATIAMVLLIVMIVVMIVVVRIPFTFSVNTILPVGLLPFVGMGVAYLICLFPPFNIRSRARKAISVETGIQNSGIANSVLILSFGENLEIYSNAVTIPLIYNIAQTVLMIVIVAGYRLWMCKSEHPVVERAEEDEELKAPPDDSCATEHQSPDNLKDKVDSAKVLTDSTSA